MAASTGCVPFSRAENTKVLHMNCHKCKMPLDYVILADDADGSRAKALREKAAGLGYHAVVNEISGITDVCVCEGDPPILMRLTPDV